MAWRYTAAAWQAQGLTTTQKLVLLRLADSADDDGYCWPSHRLIALDVGIKDRALRYVLRDLEALGHLTIEARQRQNGAQSSNGYRLALEAQSVATPPGNQLPPPPGNQLPPEDPVRKNPPGEEDPPVAVPKTAHRHPPSGGGQAASAPSEPQAAGNLTFDASFGPGKAGTESGATPNSGGPPPGKHERNSNGFESFWEAYPRKVGKGQARKAWLKLRPDRELQGVILAAVRAQSVAGAQLERGKSSSDGRSVVPHPSTWLNGQRWEDEVEGVIDENEAVMARWMAGRSHEA